MNVIVQCVKKRKFQIVMSKSHGCACGGASMVHDSMIDECMSKLRSERIIMAVK